jgi:hypothetical protein
MDGQALTSHRAPRDLDEWAKRLFLIAMSAIEDP